MPYPNQRRAQLYGPPQQQAPMPHQTPASMPPPVSMNQAVTRPQPPSPPMAPAPIMPTGAMGISRPAAMAQAQQAMHPMAMNNPMNDYFANKGMMPPQQYPQTPNPMGGPRGRSSGWNGAWNGRYNKL